MTDLIKEDQMASSRGTTTSEPRQAAIDQVGVADYEAVLADHNRLVRRLDILLNGAGCASQASLCDLVAQLETEAHEPLIQRIAGSDWTDLDLSYVGASLFGGIPAKTVRRDARAAIRTLQAILRDARALVGNTASPGSPCGAAPDVSDEVPGSTSL